MELPYFLHTDSHNTVSHVYEIMSHDDNAFLLSLLQMIPRSATWMMLLSPHTPGLSLTQLSSDKSHSGSRSQLKDVRGFCEGIEPPSVVGYSGDVLLIKNGVHCILKGQ